MTKSLGFLIAHITLTGMFFFVLFYAKTYLIGIGVPIILALAGNITQFTGFNVRDNKNRAQNYRWELDSKMIAENMKLGGVQITAVEMEKKETIPGEIQYGGK